jgi:hypothetical protein
LCGARADCRSGKPLLRNDSQLARHAMAIYCAAHEGAGMVEGLEAKRPRCISRSPNSPRARQLPNRSLRATVRVMYDYMCSIATARLQGNDCNGAAQEAQTYELQRLRSAVPQCTSGDDASRESETT